MLLHSLVKNITLPDTIEIHTSQAICHNKSVQIAASVGITTGAGNKDRIKYPIQICIRHGQS